MSKQINNYLTLKIMVQIRKLKFGDFFTFGGYIFHRGIYCRSSRTFCCQYVRTDGILCENYREFYGSDIVDKI